MKRALQLAWPENEAGTRALFKMEPPFEINDESHNYVIVSAVDIEGSGPHTFVFAANSDGDVLSWSELDGTKGVKDIWHTLRALDYEPVGLIESSSDLSFGPN
jgi:hypothetical protein